MSDLINRKAVMDWLRELQAQSIINENHGTLVDATISSTVNHFINFIVQVPTAYDVDKVVEKLEKEAVPCMAIGKCYRSTDEEGGCEECVKRKAIEIVKGGLEE